MEGWILIFGILFVGYLGFLLTLEFIGNNPKGRALSILAAIICSGLYIYAGTKINPEINSTQEILYLIFLIGPVALFMVIKLLNYIFKPTEEGDNLQD